MSKITSNRQKNLRRRGRPAIEGRLREPNGRLSRAKNPVQKVALEARARHNGLTLQQAAEQMAQMQTQRTQQAVLDRLTSREQQVLERIVAGRLNKQIAGDLNISIKTVEAHRANIMEKLEVTTVADLMKIALTQAPVQAVVK